MAVGGEHPVEAGEVDPRFRYQGGQAGDEVQGFEDDVGRAVAIGVFRVCRYSCGPFSASDHYFLHIRVSASFR